MGGHWDAPACTHSSLRMAHQGSVRMQISEACKMGGHRDASAYTWRAPSKGDRGLSKHSARGDTCSCARDAPVCTWRAPSKGDRGLSKHSARGDTCSCADARSQVRTHLRLKADIWQPQVHAVKHPPRALQQQRSDRG